MAKKFKDALAQLAEALAIYERTREAKHIAFLSVAKAFEVALEYAWKELKRHVEAEGLEAPSPKEAIRQAAKLGVLADAKLWLDFIDTRNSSTHDYFGISDREYLIVIERFYNECQGLKIN